MKCTSNKNNACIYKFVHVFDKILKLSLSSVYAFPCFENKKNYIQNPHLKCLKMIVFAFGDDKSYYISINCIRNRIIQFFKNINI